MSDEAVGFPAAWCGTDLGDYRPCRELYEHYPYDSLPVLDTTRFVGEFQWLGDPGEAVPEQVAKLADLERRLAAEGLALPEDFVTFHSASNLRYALAEVSVTGCWSSLPGPIPSPVEPGAFLVCFLGDQQDCVLWYLYLRPSGESFVVNSHLDFAREVDDLVMEEAIVWCAPDFEQFAYRFWVENRLREAVNDDDEASLDRELRAYLDHYGASVVSTEAG